MKKILAVFLIAGSAFFVSCTKSGALIGSASSSSSFTTITGSANGGLSPIGGASVNLYLAGTSTPVASATTAADGSFSIVFNGQTSGNFLYLTIAGGNAGSGTNSNNQLMSIVGTSGAPLSSLKVNEISTAATELVGMNMGLLSDNNGTITLNAPKNAAGANNAVTQFGNLIANGNLNTPNSNLTTSAQNGLAVMANAFASCIENSSNCSKLFSSATTSGGTNALTVLESGYYALLNSSNVASPLYTLAFPLNSTTGYNLTSASMPGGFSFNNPLAATQNAFTTGSGPQGIAFDASGNAWIADAGGTTLVELNSSGSILNTFSVGSAPIGVAIDASGNLWIVLNTGGNVIQMSPSGTTLGTFSVGSGPQVISIDSAGSIWVGNQNGLSGTTVTKLNSSGTTLGTFTVGTAPHGIAIDTSGNVWIGSYRGGGSGNLTELSSSGVTLNTETAGGNGCYTTSVDPQGNIWVSNFDGNKITKLNSLGAVIGSFTTGGNGPNGIAIDPSGTLWVGNRFSNKISELSSSGITLGSYSLSAQPAGVAIDPTGNVWVTVGLGGGTTVTQIAGVASGPQFFSYSGPIFAGGNL